MIRLFPLQAHENSQPIFNLLHRVFRNATPPAP